jgi:hypothetical protein
MVVLEALLISAGVFLGLLGDQWREDSQRRELAEDALRRFRGEMIENRESVAAVQDYHVDIKSRIDAYFAAEGAARDTVIVRLQGLLPAILEHTAWDLAIATQALADVDPELAFEISRIYTTQSAYASITTTATQAIYLIPQEDGPGPLLRAIQIWLGDVVLTEPNLVRAYDSIVPRIDAALAK